MNENTIFYDDQQFEQLVRGYDRRKDRGVTGVIDRIAIFREAHNHLEPERFDRFCERGYIRSNIEKDMLHHFGRRLEELNSILGSQLEAFCVLQTLLVSREEFETVKKSTTHYIDPDARSLFRDLVDGLVSSLSRLKPGDPDQDIYGMTWKTDLLPKDPGCESE
jgi:hypothetical protein